MNKALRGLILVLLWILPGILLGPPPAFSSSTSVQSSAMLELQTLGSALTKISGEDCEQIESNGSGFSFDTLRCLPAPLRRLIGQGPELHGPNCFNLSNISSGLQPFVRYVSETESEFYTNPLAGYCAEVKRPPEPGDYVMVVGKVDEQSVQIHSYIYLTDEFAITKNGPEESEHWKIGRIEEIRARYMSDSNYAGPAKKSSIEQVYYKCSGKGEAKDPAIRTLSKPLIAFGKAMESPVLTKPITQKMVSEISRSLAVLKKAFGVKAVAALKNSSDRYEGMRPLLEAYSHIATFKMIDLTEVGRFESPEAARAFAKVRAEYASFVKDLIGRTNSLGLVSDELL